MPWFLGGRGEVQPLVVPADISGALQDLDLSPLRLSACKCSFGSLPFLRNQKLGPKRTSGGQIQLNCGKINSHYILFKRYLFNLTLKAFPGELLENIFPLLSVTQLLTSCMCCFSSVLSEALIQGRFTEAQKPLTLDAETVPVTAAAGALCASLLPRHTCTAPQTSASPCCWDHQEHR